MFFFFSFCLVFVWFLFVFMQERGFSAHSHVREPARTLSIVTGLALVVRFVLRVLLRRLYSRTYTRTHTRTHTHTHNNHTRARIPVACTELGWLDKPRPDARTGGLPSPDAVREAIRARPPPASVALLRCVVRAGDGSERRRRHVCVCQRCSCLPVRDRK